MVVGCMVMWTLTDQSSSDNQETGNPLIAQVCFCRVMGHNTVRAAQSQDKLEQSECQASNKEGPHVRELSLQTDSLFWFTILCILFEEEKAKQNAILRSSFILQVSLKT